jgi:ABC-type phosphate transport system substrate-binding protein
LKKPLLVLTLVLALGNAGAGASEQVFQLIAHPGVSGTAVSKDIVAGIFLKKVQRWGDGQSIEVVDLTATSEVREAFSQAVLGMPVAGVRAYWSDKMGKGIWPPRTKETDVEVVDYVASHPGGIGYVAVGTAVPSTVKVLKVL